jgi:hypothetical protein
VDALIAAAVIDHRHRQWLPKALEYGMGILGRGDQVNIMGSLGDELEINFPKPFHRYFDALLHFGNLIVLAIYAGQVAARKKDGACAPGAGNAGLFPVMESGPGNHRKHAAAAVSCTSFIFDRNLSFHFTCPGANIAYGHHFSSLYQIAVCRAVEGADG